MHQKVIPLRSTVASFTQPSHVSNQWIAQKISDWSRLLNAQKILEFGCRIGNLGFTSLKSPLTQLTALEFEALSLQAFLRNTESFDIQIQIQVLRGDFRNTLLESSDFEYDLMLLNPARNGVGSLLKDTRLRPEYIIYMSCYPESFAVDIQNLSINGY